MLSLKSYWLQKMAKTEGKEEGFTLTELLIAIVISAVVIGAAGFGLVEMLKSNQDSDLKTTRRIELNRAFAFISDDIRKSQWVRPVSASEYTIATSCGTATPLLEVMNNGTKTLYYYKDINNCTDVFLKPAVIKRLSGVTNSSISDTGTELIDAIYNTTPPSPPTCNAVTVNSSSFSSNSVAVGGFYGCFDKPYSSSSSTYYYQSGQIYLYGCLRKNKNASCKSYQVTSNIITRSTDPNNTATGFISSISSVSSSSSFFSITYASSLTSSSSSSSSLSSSSSSSSSSLSASSCNFSAPPMGTVVGTVNAVSKINFTMSWSSVCGATRYEVYQCGPGTSSCTPTTSNTRTYSSAANSASQPTNVTVSTSSTACFAARAFNSANSSTALGVAGCYTRP